MIHIGEQGETAFARFLDRTTLLSPRLLWAAFDNEINALPAAVSHDEIPAIATTTPDEPQVARSIQIEVTSKPSKPLYSPVPHYDKQPSKPLYGPIPSPEQPSKPSKPLYAPTPSPVTTVGPRTSFDLVLRQAEIDLTAWERRYRGRIFSDVCRIVREAREKVAEKRKAAEEYRGSGEVLRAPPMKLINYEALVEGLAPMIEGLKAEGEANPRVANLAAQLEALVAKLGE